MIGQKVFETVLEEFKQEVLAKVAKTKSYIERIK